MTLSGKRVVILGGTSGIGLATARAAVDAGAEVVVASSRATNVDKAVAELGAAATGQVVDLLDEAAIGALFAELGPLDHLVYTAGEALRLTPLPTLDTVQAQAFFRIRYFGALAAVRAAAPRIRPGGSVTLTSGNAAERPASGWALGASVCGAINALTRALAVELAPIRVNAVAPGVVRSPLWSAMNEAEREEFYRGVGGSLPVGRVGEVDDIAAAYLFCLTQDFATGSVYTVDGGGVLV